MKKANLSAEFFHNSSEVLNRSFDRDEENVPARVMERHAKGGGCQSACQCVSCQNTGCNKRG